MLEAQRRRAVAQAAFWSAVAEYNKSIADLHTRKGSILEYNGIGFEEGPWPQKAYWDALARARERDAGTYIDYGWTRPKVISRGATPHGNVMDHVQIESMPGAEVIGTPEPTPANKPATEGTGPRPVPVETRSTPAPRIPVGSALRGVPSAIGTGIASAKVTTDGQAPVSTVALTSADETIVEPPVIARPIPKPTNPVVTRNIEPASSNPLRGGNR